jgi:hypothetical protein
VSEFLVPNGCCVLETALPANRQCGPGSQLVSLNQGHLLAFSQEEAEFVLNALEAKPTLYGDEIQSHIQAMTGTLHPTSTILAELKFQLDMTKKVARTVNPACAGYIDEIQGFDASYLVFLGKFLCPYISDRFSPADLVGPQMNVVSPAKTKHGPPMGVALNGCRDHFDQAKSLYCQWSLATGSLLVLPRKAPCAVWTWSILLRRSW